MVLQLRLGDVWLWVCSRLNRFEVAGFQTPLGPIIHSRIDLNSGEGRGILAHELEHREQMKRLGLLRFYVTYLRQWRRYGYRNMPLEVEARQAQARARSGDAPSSA